MLCINLFYRFYRFYNHYTRLFLSLLSVSQPLHLRIRIYTHVHSFRCTRDLQWPNALMPRHSKLININSSSLCQGGSRAVVRGTRCALCTVHAPDSREGRACRRTCSDTEGGAP